MVGQVGTVLDAFKLFFDSVSATTAAIPVILAIILAFYVLSHFAGGDGSELED